MHGQGLRESVPSGPNPWLTSGSDLNFPARARGVVEGVGLNNSPREMGGIAALLGPPSRFCQSRALSLSSKCSRWISTPTFQKKGGNATRNRAFFFKIPYTSVMCSSGLYAGRRGTRRRLTPPTMPSCHSQCISSNVLNTTHDDAPLQLTSPQYR